MPRYFFNCEGAQNFRDAEGTELPDLHAARIEAVRNAAEVMQDHPKAFSGQPRWRIFVTDEVGATVFAPVLTAEHPLAAAG